MVNVASASGAVPSTLFGAKLSKFEPGKGQPKTTYQPLYFMTQTSPTSFRYSFSDQQAQDAFGHSNMVCAEITHKDWNIVTKLTEAEGGGTRLGKSTCFGVKNPMFNEDNQRVLTLTVQKN